jgi:hypothetical protein
LSPSPLPLRCCGQAGLACRSESSPVCRSLIKAALSESVRTTKLLMSLVGPGMVLCLSACGSSSASKSAFATASDAAKFVRHQLLSQNKCTGITGHIQCRAQGAGRSCRGSSDQSITLGPVDSSGHFNFACWRAAGGRSIRQRASGLELAPYQ